MHVCCASASATRVTFLVGESKGGLVASRTGSANSIVICHISPVDQQLLPAALGPMLRLFCCLLRCEVDVTDALLPCDLAPIIIVLPWPRLACDSASEPDAPGH